jgi:hypothetical protein
VSDPRPPVLEDSTGIGARISCDRLIRRHHFFCIKKLRILARTCRRFNKAICRIRHVRYIYTLSSMVVAQSGMKE